MLQFVLCFDLSPFPRREATTLGNTLAARDEQIAALELDVRRHAAGAAAAAAARDSEGALHSTTKQLGADLEAQVTNQPPTYQPSKQATNQPIKRTNNQPTNQAATSARTSLHSYTSKLSLKTLQRPTH